MVVPTSAEIRRARADRAQQWARRRQVMEGPFLAGLGLTGITMGVLAAPISPLLTRAGLRPLTDQAETVAPLPSARVNGSTVAVLNPWLSARAAEGSVADRPPAPLRAGVYGELAWRGWHMVHRLGTARPIAAVLVRARRAVQSFNSAVERCADELHDGSEEAMGRLIMGVHQLPRRIAAAVLAAAYTLRSLTATTNDEQR